MYRVLIAEDEEIIRRGVCNALCWKDVGCELCGAVENGAEAIRAIRSFAPDILLCDIRMPEKSGLEVAQFVKENRIDCKILLLTGYSDFSYAQQAITYGVFDYLLKPISSEELTAAIFRATSALDEARLPTASHPAPDAPETVTGAAPEKFMEQLLFACVPPSPNTIARADTLGLRAPRFSIALVPVRVEGKNASLAGIALPFEWRAVLARLFSGAAQKAAFHCLLPEHDGVVALCMGYSEEVLTPFYCWETLQTEFCHETHGKLPLLICEPSAGLTELYTAFHTAQPSLSSAAPAPVSTKNPVVQSVLNYLWAHYASPIKLADVADHVFLNPSYISRIVCKETGMNFVDHLLFIRVQEAKRFLLMSQYRTFEIAEMTGFGSVKYFSQVFRQLTGMSPSQYRSRAGVRIHSGTL